VKKSVNVKREERVYRVLEALENSRAIQGQTGHPLPKPLILIQRHIVGYIADPERQVTLLSVGRG